MWIYTERIASFPSKKWTDGKTETYGSDQKHTAQLSGQWQNQGHRLTVERYPFKTLWDCRIV